MVYNNSQMDPENRFHSWGSARETFDWSDMCNIELPIPSIEKQQAVVAIHHALETRKEINEKLKDAIRPLCPVLVRGVIQGLSQNEIEAA